MIKQPFNIYGKVKELQEDVESLLRGSTSSPEVIKQVEILTERVNEIVKIEQGDSSGNVELIDIRTGADGQVYETAGEAVRTQILKLQNALLEIDNTINAILQNETF